MINKSDAERPNWGRLNFKQRYLYWAAILTADDEGITTLYHLHKEHGDIGAFDEADLMKLQEEGYIHLYKVDMDTYLQILFWWNNQFLDVRYYKPTVCPTTHFYLPRPESLRKTKRNNSFYDASGEPLVQYRAVEVNSAQPNEAESSIAETRIDDDTGEVDLPFEADGTTNPNYINATS